MRIQKLFRAGALLLLLGFFLSGCGFFGKPALPRRTSLESLRDPTVDEFAASIKRAEVIYFPVESLDVSAAQVIRALRDDAKPFAIAWQDLSADNQVTLDQLAGASADSIVTNRLTWNSSVQSRESRQGILRLTPDLPHLAIGLPKVLWSKLRTDENLNAEERLMIPDGYRTPPGDLENFAERYASRGRWRGADISRLYRMRVTAEQYAAEKIVTYLQQHPDTKILVFLSNRDMTESGGVPNFVTQKIKVHQLILDVGHRANERPRMLTSRSCSISRGLL